MNHIELFAGCGGLCLGLESAGFKLLTANELSPMAAQTFAFNILKEDLEKEPRAKSHALWIASQYSREQMAKRLREDPRSYPEDLSVNTDLTDYGSNLKGSLVIGNVLSLNQWLEARPDVQKLLASAFGEGEVDLVSGGPPCQSFSLAGLREKNNEKNSLPWAFAKFSELVKPRVVLLENVTGILRPFKENGQLYHAWLEVAKAFAGIGYIPLTLHINAKFAGVAQNRPRFILLGVREDVFEQLVPHLNATERKLFESAVAFVQKLKNQEPVNEKTLTVHDLNTGDESVFEMFKDSFLKPLCVRPKNFISVKAAIEDLRTDLEVKPSEYVKSLNRLFKGALAPRSAEADWSHRIIDNQPRVRRRFRIYQVMSQLSNDSRRAIGSVLAGKELVIDDRVWDEVRGFEFLNEDGKLATIATKEQFLEYLGMHLTKKQTQRALMADDPAPAALSIPDDACHYAELRTLSAREMARIQSFPDNFIFRSKMTTGGQCRKFEVPIYTQIGNAVPVLLGRALGLSVSNLLSRLTKA